MEFHSIDALPKSTYGVYPFVQKLKRWILKNFKKKVKAMAGVTQSPSQTRLQQGPPAGANVGAGAGGNSNNSKSSGKSQQPSPKVRLMDPRKVSPNPIRARNAFDTRNADTFDVANQSKGWGVDAMFKANAKLTGKSYNEYDGNPQAFGSSHPRYTNYNGGIACGAENSLFAFEELSQMSLVGHKLLRGDEAATPTYDDDYQLALAAGKQVKLVAGDNVSLDDIVGDDIKMLPKSTYTVNQEAAAAASGSSHAYKWTSYKLRHPFVFNAANIMSAVDLSLRQTMAI